MLNPQYLEAIPAQKGAYILDIRVTRSFNWKSRAGNELSFKKGRYLYCGSANGSGGLKARLRRHCLRDKKPHWHVDPLTIAFGVKALYFTSDQTECDLVEIMIQKCGATVPFPGFGSSDCPTCQSHLVEFNAKESLSRFFNPAQVLDPKP